MEEEIQSAKDQKQAISVEQHSADDAFTMNNTAATVLHDSTRSKLEYQHQTSTTLLHNLELAVINPAIQAHQVDEIRSDAIAQLMHKVQTTPQVRNLAVGVKR